MAAGNWIMFDAAKTAIGNGAINFANDALKITLHTNAYVPNRSTQALYADLTNELATGGGYTNGGQTLTRVTFTQQQGVATFTCVGPSWTASTGASIGPFRIAVIRDSSPTGQPLICYCVLETADLLASNGQSFQLTINAAGILTLSGATS